jgi:hypothetical protein
VPRPKKADDVFRILKDRDSRFVIYHNRGKGSRQMLEHPDIDARRASFPVPYHKGRLEERAVARPDSPVPSSKGHFWLSGGHENDALPVPEI